MRNFTCQTKGGVWIATPRESCSSSNPAGSNLLCMPIASHPHMQKGGLHPGNVRYSLVPDSLELCFVIRVPGKA